MDLSSFLSTVNKDSLVGLSAPILVPEEGCAIIGYYCPQMGAGHLQITSSELESVADVLYTGRHFPCGYSRLEENSGGVPSSKP